ncbi:unnamed protein product [Cyclocybe aegerita]|uniref:Uncharacterized protein n=1 Tax=Cyclocybe aegerita TaxID=1973307 RepID=A0A8S0VSF2_CYCAE|nr:unnamed protein product [Cyclocybe aegerita]
MPKASQSSDSTLALTIGTPLSHKDRRPNRPRNKIPSATINAPAQRELDGRRAPNLERWACEFERRVHVRSLPEPGKSVLEIARIATKHAVDMHTVHPGKVVLTICTAYIQSAVTRTYRKLAGGARALEDKTSLESSRQGWFHVADAAVDPGAQSSQDAARRRKGSSKEELRVRWCDIDDEEEDAAKQG